MPTTYHLHTLLQRNVISFHIIWLINTKSIDMKMWQYTGGPHITWIMVMWIPFMWAQNFHMVKIIRKFILCKVPTIHDEISPKYFENISKQMIQLELQDNKLDWEMKKLLSILEKIKIFWLIWYGFSITPTEFIINFQNISAGSPFLSRLSLRTPETQKTPR